ncbi:MAG: PaaI family thioesterase [Acidimicrobiia bacterium]|nr:PaaI family thioesterase [Acidimicrobiia bacterium]
MVPGENPRPTPVDSAVVAAPAPPASLRDPGLTYDATFSAYLDLSIEPADADGVVRASLPVRDDLKQLMGILHGGIYAAVAEEVASVATAEAVLPDGRVGLGQSNLTHFLRPVTGGTLTAVATPQHRGRTSWVWSIEMLDDDGRRCAVSTVTMAVRPVPVGGEAPAPPPVLRKPESRRPVP